MSEKEIFKKLGKFVDSSYRSSKSGKSKHRYYFHVDPKWIDDLRAKTKWPFENDETVMFIVEKGHLVIKRVEIKEV